MSLHSVLYQHAYMHKPEVGWVGICGRRRIFGGWVASVWYLPEDDGGREMWFVVPFEKLDGLMEARDIPEALGVVAS